MKNSIIFISLTILFAFSVKAQEKGDEQNPSANSVLCDRIQDEGLKMKCEKFNQALLNKELTSPKGESAYDLYGELEKAEETKALAAELKSELLAALQNEIQAVMEIVSRLPMEELTIRLIFDRSYQDYRDFTQALSALSETNVEETKRLQFQENYFEGLILKEKAKSRQSQDTTILREAIRKQMQALENNLESPYPYQEMGDLFFELGDFGQAIIFYNSALKREPDLPGPLLGINRFYIKAKEEEKALALAEQINAQELKYGLGHLNSARTNAIFGKPENSLAQYKMAVKQLMDAYRSEKGGFQIYALYQLADIASQFELYDRAETILQTILARRQAPELHLALANIYELTDRTLSADSLYRICIQKWPEHIGAYHRQGLLYHGLGRYREAVQYYQNAYDLNPRHREICYNLGSLRHLFKQHAEAKALYRQALIYPEGMEAVYTVMDTIMSMLKTKGSAKVELMTKMQDPQPFFKANIRLPADKPVSGFEDYIYYQLGKLYSEQDSTNRQVETMYKTALLLNPGLEEAYKGLIQWYWYQKNHQQALIFSELYKLYVPYSRENKDAQKLIGNIARDARKKGAKPLSEPDKGVYTYFFDGFWPYIYGLNRTEVRLDLDPWRMAREKRTIREMMGF